jgi:hypothetical protein
VKELFGNLWEFDGIIVITTNGFVKRDGTCVMGRGCAKQATIKLPGLPTNSEQELPPRETTSFTFLSTG